MSFRFFESYISRDVVHGASRTFITGSETYDLTKGLTATMRLLHAEDRVFKEFIGSDIPEYVIISHRWSEEEISYQDFLDSRREGYRWRKIDKACQIALERKYKWVWIDTCELTGIKSICTVSKCTNITLFEAA